MTESSRRSIAPIAIGIGLTAFLLVVIGYAASRRRASEDETVPALLLISPVGGERVDSPLVVRFGSTEPIALRPSGWGHGRLHLHAWIGGVELMPGPRDITALAGGQYEWTLPAVRRDSNQDLHLGWADAAHRPLVQGTTARVLITVH